ncbi:hypothetical protein GOBAR_DD22436 [Gossypium barbadense]|nr:hypothetical protein GOBAR_DD22436 [Gossypium barbadense]
MKLSSTFAPALNQPLPRGDRLFLMPPSSTLEKLKVKVGQNPYVDSANLRFHPFMGKGKASVQLKQKSFLKALAAYFLGEQKTISGFLGLGTSSGRTSLNHALNPNLRIHMKEQGEPAATPSQASSSSNCDNLA